METAEEQEAEARVALREGGPVEQVQRAADEAHATLPVVGMRRDGAAAALRRPPIALSLGTVATRVVVAVPLDVADR